MTSEENDPLELNLLQIAKRIIFRWRIFVFIVVVTTTALLAFSLFYVTTTNRVIRQDIRLFGLLSNYENGVPFSINDFYEPDILRELFETTGLSDIDEEDYRDLIKITPTREDIGFIREKYAVKARIITEEKSDDTLAQLQNLALERDAEIASLQPDTYTLQVNHEQFGLAEESAKLLLEKWPVIWENHMMARYRVLTDLSLNSMALIENQYLGKPEAAYYARQELNFIKNNIGKFKNDPRFKKLKSNKGRTPVELEIGINEYDTVLFTPLYSSVLSIDSGLSDFYLKDQRLTIDQMDKQIASLQSIVDDITTMEIGTRTNAVQQTQTGSGVSGDIIQIGDGTLNDIVGLVQKASLQDFLTQVLERRHSLVVQKTNVEKSLEQVDSNKLLTEEFIQSVSNIHVEIIEEYNDLLSKAEKVALDNHLTMYSYKNAAYIKGDNLLHPKTKYLSALPILFCVIAGLIIMLIPLPYEKSLENLKA